jgi:hypothetical protein
MQTKKLFAIGLFITLPLLSYSQHETIHHDQIWVGYITTTDISKRYSLWNDVHIVPHSFSIMRTGLTRNISKHSTATAGYAFVWLPLEHNELKRHEHRPWGQLQLALPLSALFTMTQRIRYDARFKETINAGEIAEGYSFNHRIRYLISVRYNVCRGEKLNPFVTVSNEILLNFGKGVTYNVFDQNRLSLAGGMQYGNTQYQLGFMNRLVQTSKYQYALNHTILLWITQKFDTKKALKKN